MERSPVRLILADPGLSGPAGHHLGYVEAVAEAAMQRGLAPLILAHQAFLPDPRQANILPTFSAQYQASGAGGRGRAAILAACSRLPPWASGPAAEALRRLHRGLRRGRADSFGRELAAALRQQLAADSDVLVLPSVSSANLAGLADAPEPAALGRIAVILRRLPTEMDQSDPLAGPPSGRLLDMACRCRGGRRVERVLDLGDQPHCSRLARPDLPAGTEPAYPLRVRFCRDDTLVPIDRTIPKESMFSNYPYVSGTTETLSEPQIACFLHQAEEGAACQV